MKWLHLFSSPLSVAASLTALAPLTISCSGGPSGETSPRDGGALGLDAGTFGVDGDTSTVEAGAPTDDATETADSRALDSGIDGAESDGQVVSVSGAQLTLNGVPWLSRGVVLQGFVRPLAVLQGDAGSADLLRARTSFGAQELAAIQQFDADTIRFQIGQPWLNPGSAYEPDYLNEVVDGITMARQAGFVVMIMMQDEAISGETTHHPLPTQETEDAWGLLTAAFGADRGVVFELYNEPDLLASPASWARWLDGDKTPDGGVPSALGMQDLVTYVREEGAQNVLVLDGLGLVVQDDAGPELAETLEGVPAVTDPLNRLVYAVHPYQHGLAAESYWDDAFGKPSARAPVWADEWSGPEGLALCLGSLTDYQVAVDLLNYLRAHRISLCTGAFDVPKFVVNDVPGWGLTSYASTSQYASSGTLVFNDFAAKYEKALTKSDGL